MVSSRPFKVHHHCFNTKMLEFMKVLSLDVEKDEISRCILETRSLRLEYIALSKLAKIYQQYLD